MKVCESVNIFKQTLSEAILLLCKSELRFNQEFCIDGLLGITIDQNEVILIKINENLVAGNKISNVETSKPFYNDLSTDENDVCSYSPDKSNHLNKIKNKQIKQMEVFSTNETLNEPTSPLNYAMNNGNSMSNILIKNEPEFCDYVHTNSQNEENPYVVDVMDELNANASIALSREIIKEIALNDHLSNSSLKDSSSQLYIKRETYSPSTEILKNEKLPLDRIYKPNKSISSIHENFRNLHEPCSNCGTRATTMWRRSSTGLLMCNACGLYLKLHGINRPLSYVRDNIQVRRRRRMENKDHLVHYAKEITSEYLSFTKRDQTQQSQQKWTGNFWSNPGFWSGVGSVLQAGNEMGTCSATVDSGEGRGEEDND